MRKPGILCALTFLLISCSIPGINLAPTGSPPERPATTAAPPTATATITPTLPTPTFTNTPTLSGVMPATAAVTTPAATFTPLPLFSDTLTPQLFYTGDAPGEGFHSVQISGNEIYWGICKPGTVKITAEVTDPAAVYNVVIFVRLQDGESTDTTPWSKGAAMDDRGEGIFSYDLDADTIAEKNSYRRSWVLYQLVATDRPGNIIGRTRVYRNSLTLRPCP